MLIRHYLHWKIVVAAAQKRVGRDDAYLHDLFSILP